MLSIGHMLKDNNTFTQALMGIWPVQAICSHARLEKVDVAKMNESYAIVRLI